MKLFSLLAILGLFAALPQVSYSQVFWTETFGAGCNSGTPASGFVSTNGTWDVTSTGTNGAEANIWYISAEENAEGPGNCGAGCGNNPTLHIGRADGDVGATYLNNNSTGDPTTDIRVESPTIDCSNECQILLSFDVIHNGDLLNDNCILWYFDGATWSAIGSPSKTLTTCAPAGLWENFSVYLPSSANNNPDVRVGFQWVNNDDGLGADASVALHNIQLASADIEDPTLTCASDINVFVDANCDAQIPDLLLPPSVVIGDNCTSIADLVTTQDIPSGTILSGHLSVQTVEITVTDLAGNSNTCSIDVRAIDTIAPTLICPVTVPAIVDATCQSALDDYTSLLNPVDNCAAFADLIITQSPTNGTVITADQLVEFSVTDLGGNTRTCSFTVELLDTISPLITCPVDQVQETALGLCDTTLLDYTNMIIWSDNCTSPANILFSQSPTPLSTVTGSTVVQLLVEDEGGNISSCTFNLEVIDVEVPSITCPSDQEQPTNAACNILLDDYTTDGVLLDNCSLPQNILVTQTPAVGSIHSGEGTIVQITLTATDESGNANSCVFDVEVTDTTSPVVFCPANQSVSTNVNCEYELTDFSALVSATDNCTATGDFTFSNQTPIGTVFQLGANEVFMIGEDESGNTGTCSFTITVEDNTAPIIIDCAPNQTLPLQANCEGILDDYTSLVNATDECDVVVDLVITQNPLPGTVVSSDLSVTITVEDLNGNSSQCVFNVVVEDQEAPIINCPIDTVIVINAICEYGAPDLTGIVSGLDNCSLLADMTIVQTPIAGTTLSGIDQIEVTLTDENGNATSCFVSTIPDDNIAPVITCPADVVINNGTICDYTLPDYALTTVVVEECPNFTLVQLPAAGDVVSAGSHIIEMIVTDAGGNESSCSFNLDVIENVDPLITCPANIVQCDPDITYSDPTVSDNCAVSSVDQIDVSGFTSGDTFPVGVTIQTYEVADASGNTASCSFTIEVLESPDVAEILTTTVSLCDTTSLVLNANLPQAGTGEWSVLTGGASLNNQFSNNTGANNLDFGVNQFVWEITSALCGSTSDTLTVVVYQQPFPASVPNDTLLKCNDTLINITGNSPNAGQGNWYSTNPSVNFLNSAQSNTVAFNLSDGWNDMIWEISNGSCQVTTDTIRVFSTPQATIQNNDTTLCIENNMLDLVGTAAFPGMQTLWYLIQGTGNIVSGNSTNTEVTGMSAGENIIVHALTHPVCSNSYDTLIVTIEQCQEYDPIIPTVFTPNNDGKNDLFIIDNLQALYPECEVKIVNRWGNLVFESNGYLDPWDGTRLESGELLPTGTYFYRVYLNDDALTEITGSISIIR